MKEFVFYEGSYRGELYDTPCNVENANIPTFVMCQKMLDRFFDCIFLAHCDFAQNG